MVRSQKCFVSDIFTKAKKLIANEDTEKEGAILLLRSFKGLPKTNAIIKYLSEEGMKTLMLKTENIYLAENQKRMPEITEDLFFVIDEKNNTIDLTEKGIDLISGDMSDSSFFVMPDIGSEVAEIEKSELGEDEKLAIKDKMLSARNRVISFYFVTLLR